LALQDVRAQKAVLGMNKDQRRRAAALLRMSMAEKKERRIGIVKFVRYLLAEGVVHEIAELIEKDAPHEEAFTKQDVQDAHNIGLKKGREQAAHQPQPPEEFYDAFGQPRWNAIALFCQRNRHRLQREAEQSFVDDMAGMTIYRIPTDKQGKWLRSIFVKLGGPHHVAAD
jgi:hypothetical protein